MESYRSTQRCARVVALAAALAVVAAAYAFGAAPAQAAEVANGGFESGDLSGWTVENQEGGSGDWFVYGEGRENPFGCLQAAPPPQGDFAARTSQNGPGSHVLYQGVRLEPGAEHRLSFTLYYESTAPIAAPDTLDYTVSPNQQYRVDVMKAGSPAFSLDEDDVLATVFRTVEGDPQILPPTRMTFDLSRFAGQTVRLRFAEVDNQGCFAAAVDDVQIETSAAPGPAKCTIEGTKGSDTLIGTPGDDVICGYGGGDSLVGKGGDDILRGGPGGDSLDTTDGVRGNDTADGGRGQDACATDRRDERISC